MVSAFENVFGVDGGLGRYLAAATTTSKVTENERLTKIFEGSNEYRGRVINFANFASQKMNNSRWVENVRSSKNSEIRKSFLLLLRAVPISKNLEKVESEAGDAKTKFRSSQTRSRTPTQQKNGFH